MTTQLLPQKVRVQVTSMPDGKKVGVFVVNKAGWGGRAFKIARKKYPELGTLHGKLLKP